MIAQYFTKKGLQDLQDKLEYLKGQKRQEIAQRIQTAKELGDLSENAEYSAAKEEQALNEKEVRRLIEITRNAQIIKKNSSSDIVEIGSKVTAKLRGKKIELTIVGSSEADPAQGRISNASPLGQAFLGKSKREEVTVETPKGRVKYKISKID